MGLFQLGDFTLHSGSKSAWKIDCDALTADDIGALVRMIALLVGPFSSVEGVPRGGLRLATALKKHVDREPFFKHLIVDDVLTTGRSMRKRMEALVSAAAVSPSKIVGAVVFARGRCPAWVKALFQMPEALWTA